jgi:hypothetical protein
MGNRGTHSNLIFNALVFLGVACVFLATNNPASDILDAEISFHFHGPDTLSSIGGDLKGLGDINADGYDDIAVSCMHPSGVFVFFGGATVDSDPDMFLPSGFGPVGLIDIIADEFPDFVSYSYFGLYVYRGYADSISSLSVDSILSPPSSCSFGINSALGYASNDNIGDILTSDRCKFGGGPMLYMYFGRDPLNQDPDWEYEVDFERHRFKNSGFIDFDGDGNTDVFLPVYGSYPDDSGAVYIFKGPEFTLQPDIIIAPPTDIPQITVRYFGEEAFNMGDVNGDGWDDLGVDYQISLTWYHMIYFCGPSADTLYDLRLSGTNQRMAAAGDMNGDGYNDIACGGGGSYNGKVDIYLAGIELDPFIDLDIDNSNLPPLFLENIGYELTSAGDFNGDGFDDLVFACRNFAHGDPGDVFVLQGGADIVTDAENPNVTAPSGFELRQNYPNPFNAGTTIEFTMPRAGFAEVKIFNMLGQVVATPLVGSLPAGEQKVIWDGLTADGTPAPSGVYLYQISTDDYT